MLASKAHVKIGSYEYLLDESVEQPYIYDAQGLYDPQQQVPGGMGMRSVRADRLFWPVTDWSGGEGNRIWYPDMPTTYYDADDLNTRIPGQFTGRPTVASVSKTVTDQQKPCFLTIGGGSIWLNGSIETFDGDEALELGPAERVRLRVKWPECPDEGTCGGTERYVVYDALTQTLLDRTESFVVSWYATAGNFAEPRTEQAFGGDGEKPGTVNSWSAPTSGTVEVWAVAHDDRGGQSWAHGTVVISP